MFALVFFFFALIFHSFALLLSSCFASCPFTFFALVVFACPLVLSFLSCFVFVFSFSLADYTQKRKGAKVLPLVPSLVLLWVLNSCVVIKEFRCRCFGFFQFARLILPTNTSSIRRLARSYFDFIGHNVNIAYNRPAFLK